MKILLIGADGNVGGRLQPRLLNAGHTVLAQTIADLDITNLSAVMSRVGDFRPDLLVHCAGMTNVDRCAQEPDEAIRINGLGTKYLALACQRFNAALCYVSTNEVFDGTRGTPYREYDAANPINPYGYSKWVGEQVVRELLPMHYIVRTSWIFSHTGQNFLQRIVSRAAQGASLAVVTNEVASPTYSEDLVEALAVLVETGSFGTYHLVNEGVVSRYAFARAILDAYGYEGYPIQPVIGAQYPRPSRPPVYSALQNFMAAQMGIRLRDWRAAIAAFVVRERVTQP
jgi:dTDP-4-dehydrorhamnose reductase